MWSRVRSNGPISARLITPRACMRDGDVGGASLGEGVYKCCSLLPVVRISSLQFTIEQANGLLLREQELTSLTSQRSTPYNTITLGLQPNNHQLPSTTQVYERRINTTTMTCCGRNNGECICATEARCSCGKQPALQCSTFPSYLKLHTCANPRDRQHRRYPLFIVDVWADA